MSTDLHNNGHTSGNAPQHDTVSFEPRDVQVTTIYAYLVFMAIAVAASFFVCVFILRVATNMAAQSDTPPAPVRLELGKDYSALPPEPRLQGVPGHETDPQLDLRNKLKADTEANEKFEWVDKDAGVAQIPVKDAMKIIAQKGLPALAGAPGDKKK